MDELPQFINVLQGQMSIVGPRPHAVAHNEQYRKLIHGYMLRHTVKPGITGWAQVNGWRGETDTMDKMEMRVKYDLDYINNWSLWFDLKIIWMTIFGGMRGKNAYWVCYSISEEIFARLRQCCTMSRRRRLAWILAYLLRFNFELPPHFLNEVWRTLAWVMLLQGAGVLAIWPVSRDMAICQRERSQAHLLGRDCRGRRHSAAVLDAAADSRGAALGAGHLPDIAVADDGRRPPYLSSVERAGLVCRYQTARRTGSDPGSGRCGGQSGKRVGAQPVMARGRLS